MHGPETLKRVVSGVLASFPDVQLEFEELTAEGDKVVGRWRAWGTSWGPFAGHPPTGERVEWTGITVYRVVDWV